MEEGALEFEGLRADIGQLPGAQTVEIVAREGSDIGKQLQVIETERCYLDRNTSADAIAVVQVEIYTGSGMH